MKQRARINYTPEQKDQMWDRWEKGDSLHSIARLFDRGHSSVFGQLSPTGGIRPPARKRSNRVLSTSEREEISRGLVNGLSLRAIATQLSRAPSTISREVSRNGGYARYRATQADKKAWDRALRPKRCKLAQNRHLSRVIARKLKLKWSPEQIAGWLKREHPKEELKRVSHETIYRSLYIQARGVLKKELLQHLRSKRVIRRSKHSSLKKKGLGKITNTVSISERPASAEDRAVPGHWEGDLICGSGNSYIATLVERRSRYVMLAKVPNKDTKSVINALIKQARSLPKELYKSLTWDRGTEMADHRRFTLATDIDVYFCDPHSPWQRGSNENTNRLLRQYFPKGTDLSVHSQAKLNRVARQLNERPRKTLEYETPAEQFNACVASTG
ncbi:MAG: IS30 family transposase [Bacteroidetes bacterium]|nr:IS30 family transposase [Bacteroidota bacterium]